MIDMYVLNKVCFALSSGCDADVAEDFSRSTIPSQGQTRRSVSLLLTILPVTGACAERIMRSTETIPGRRSNTIHLCLAFIEPTLHFDPSESHCSPVV